MDIDLTLLFSVNSLNCPITSYQIHSLSSDSLYSETNISLNMATLKVVIDLSLPILKTVFIKAFTEAGNFNFL